MWWKVLFSLLLAINGLLAQTPDTGVKSKLDQIENLPPGEYFTKIDGLRVEIEQYIERKKRVCGGELSPIILQEGGVTPAPEKKGKACFRELRDFQVSFVNHLFAAREKYLNYLHEKRLGQLAKSRQKILRELQSTFN